MEGDYELERRSAVVLFLRQFVLPDVGQQFCTGKDPAGGGRTSDAYGLPFCGGLPILCGNPWPFCRQGATAPPALGFADSHGTNRGAGISRPFVSGSSTHDGNRCRADQRHRSAHDGGPGCDPAKGGTVPPSCSWWGHIVFWRDADRHWGLIRKSPAVACLCRGFI